MSYMKKSLPRQNRTGNISGCLPSARRQSGGYQQVLTRLQEGDVQKLEDYISSCEEMDHRLLRIAWELGRNYQE